ncbi:MAG: hypothetical protein OXB84_07140 [Halobacteriovoraceae bacterium]|nr:hypothetical protein [Halobacteriovoraceae bacterium]
MSDNRFSEISVEYALHINQIQKARDIFERECNGFMNDINYYLNKKFSVLHEKDCKLYVENCKELKISPSGNAKSYYSICKYPILIKNSRKKMAKYSTLGHLQIGIEFDDSLQAFAWTTLFHNNEEVLDPQLDEKMLAKIKSFNQEERDSLFQNFEQINFDGLYFQKVLIDNKFNMEFKKHIDAVVQILLSTISESEDFINSLGEAASNKIMKAVGE